MASGYDNQRHVQGSRLDWNGHDHQLRSTLANRTIKGSSFQGHSLSTLINHKSYGIVCGIEIQNWTKYELTEPKWVVKSGYISIPPVSVKPGKKEAIITHKRGYTMTGSSGIISWLVKDKDCRVVVMWSSPYFQANKMAVGLTKGITRANDSWYDTILQNKNDRDLSYELKTYSDTGEEITVEDADFQVQGSMGNSNKPEIKILFEPSNREDLYLQVSNPESDRHNNRQTQVDEYRGQLSSPFTA